MLKYNFLIFLMLIYTMIMTLTMNSWLMIWIMMELNLILFITLMIMNNLNIYDYSMKYFLINSFSSLLFIFLLNLYMLMMKLLIILMMLFILFMKLGIFPFYFWFINMMKYLNWIMCFFLMTFQKIIPLYLMLMLKYMNKFNILIMVNSLFSIMIIFNNINLKYIMSVSSMNHMSWMLYSMNFSEMLFLIYLYSYILINYSIIYLMKKMNFNYLLDFIKFYKIKINLYFLFMVLSLMSLPPFFGFLIKWLYIYKILLMSYFYLFMLMMFSLIFLYYYIRLILFLMLMNFMEIKFVYLLYIMKFKINLNLNMNKFMMINSIMNLFIMMIWLY